jgi:hypothetical protein
MGSMNSGLNFFVVVDAAWVSDVQLASSVRTRSMTRAVRLKDLETNRKVRGDC